MATPASSRMLDACGEEKAPANCQHLFPCGRVGGREFYLTQAPGAHEPGVYSGADHHQTARWKAVDDDSIRPTRFVSITCTAGHDLPCYPLPSGKQEIAGFDSARSFSS